MLISMTDNTLIWLIILSIVLGVFIGVSGYTFYYAQGLSYLSNDPASCTNCHIMNDQYNSWTKSSHHHVAVCNDCHAPHKFVEKYMAKAVNGFNHSLKFTAGSFHEPITISPMNRIITEAACRHCHQDISHAIEPKAGTMASLSCIRCHQDVGH